MDILGSFSSGNVGASVVVDAYRRPRMLFLWENDKDVFFLFSVPVPKRCHFSPRRLRQSSYLFELFPNLSSVLAWDVGKVEVPVNYH